MNALFTHKVTGTNIRFENGAACGQSFSVRFRSEKDANAWIKSCKGNVKNVKIEAL